MNPFEELSELIGEAADAWLMSGHRVKGSSPEGESAKAVIAAGYSKPRTITTVEGLDALHAKAVILDPNGTPWVCDGDVVEPWASVCEDPFGGPIWKNSRDIALPATVIHEP